MGKRWLESVGNSLSKDSCGCATGSVLLGIALIATCIWYGWHWQTSMQSPGSTAAHIFGLSFAAALVGKLGGMLLYKKRSHRYMRSIAQTSTPPSASHVNAAPQGAPRDAQNTARP